MTVFNITATLAPAVNLGSTGRLRALIGAGLSPAPALSGYVYTPAYGPGQLANDVLDGGLSVIDTAATAIHVLAATPVVFADVATYTLGNKTFSAGSAFGSPVNDPLGGRMIASTAFTDGNQTAVGLATDWAVVDGTRLLANGKLLDPVTMASSGQLIMPSFTISLPVQ